MSQNTLGQGYKAYVYKHRVAFHETDSMGVVHHSNHIKFFEEARVAWLRERGLLHIHSPEGAYVFAVVEARCRYMKTARFDDALEVWVEGTMDGLRIRFQYAIWNERTAEWIAAGETDLVALDKDLNLARMTPEIRQRLGATKWSEVWPPVRPETRS